MLPIFQKPNEADQKRGMESVKLQGEYSQPQLLTTTYSSPKHY